MSKYAAVNVKFGADISQFSTAMQNAAREMKKAGDQLQSVGRSMTMNLTAPIVALGAAALYSFGQIDSLKRGLISFSGSAALAEEEFTKLREVAKLPGVGLEEAVKGSINLQAIGVSADEARKDMMAFGNAIATVGGGKENFDLAIRGFGQLTNASKPLQQDLYQIANQLPQINKIMHDTFGTNRADELAAMGITGKQLADILVNELGKLPKVTGGIKNSFENMSDSVKISLASFGEAIEKNFNISDKINALSNWLSNLVTGFKNLDPTVQKFILGALGVVAALGPLSFVLGGIISILPMFLTGIAALGTAFTFVSGPIGMAIVGLGLISALIYKLVTDTTRFEDAEVSLAKTISDANGAISTQKTKVEELHSKLLNTNLSQEERNKLVKEFNSIAGTNLKNIGDESTFQNNLAKAYKDVNEQMAAKKFNILDIARTQKEADLEKLKQDIKLAEIAAEKYKKENVLLETPFGNLTKTPISDLFGTPIEKLNDLRDQAEAARQSIQGLSRELYKISPNGTVADIKEPPKTKPGNAGQLTPEQIAAEAKKIADEKLRLLKEMNKAEIDTMAENRFKVIAEENAAHEEKLASYRLQLIEYPSLQHEINTALEQEKKRHGEKLRNISKEYGLDVEMEDQNKELKKLYDGQGEVHKTGWDNSKTAFKKGITEFTSEMAINRGLMLQRLEEFTQSINDTLVTGVQDAIINLASAFGENLVDGDPFKDLGNVILSSLGKLMVALGSAMITFSTIFVAFKESITAMQPEIAIPLGIAMVAAGAAISKIAAKGMQGSSGSYPGNSNPSSNSGSSGGNLTLTTRLDGRDLVMSGQNTSYVKRR